MSTVAHVSHFFSLLFTAIGFIFSMVAMTTHSWRGTDVYVNLANQTLPPNITLRALGLPPVLAFEVHHGLWTSCKVAQGVSDCSRIQKSDVPDDERRRRGNITHGFLLVAIFLSFLSFGISLISVCIMKKRIHLWTKVLTLVLVFLAFICGIVAMGNFDDYFGGESFTLNLPPPPFKPLLTFKFRYEWQYSFKLGWAGAVIFALPIVTHIVEIIVRYTEIKG